MPISATLHDSKQRRSRRRLKFLNAEDEDMAQNQKISEIL